MFDRIRRNRFVVWGRAGLDLYADPIGTRIEEAENFRAAVGGSAANIAVASVKLGGQAALVTAISDDAVGRYVVNQLKAYGVSTANVRFVGGEARTSLAVVETRAVNCQSVIYRNGAADFAIQRADVDAVRWDEQGALIVTGTSLALEPSRSATLAAMKAARDMNVPVILDVDYRRYTWASPEEAMKVCGSACSLSDAVVGNDEEFAMLAGSGDGEGFARSLAQTTADVVVYKMGEHGSKTFGAAKSFATPVFKVEALKPTGAGDAFMGGFVTGLANGLSLEDSVTRGSAAAAIVVTRVGCAPAMPTVQELAEFLNTHSIR